MLEQLKTKIKNEIEEFKKEMLEKSKEDIFDAAYKISIMNDFQYLDFDLLEEEQIEFLLEENNVIEFLYEEWMDSSGFNTFGVLEEFFKYVIEDRI